MILPIVQYPDQVLKTVAAPIAKVDETIINLIHDMFDTMKSNGGIGLAANQIGQAIQLAVVQVGAAHLVLINPVIEKFGGKSITMTEGCLSLPKKQIDVTRRDKITFSTLTEKGFRMRLEAAGLLSRVIQHEIDHLNGINICDKN